MTIVERFDGFQGRVRVPGDKSISHRALILGAMGAGAAIKGLGPGADVLSTVRCLQDLRQEVSLGEDATLVSGGWTPHDDKTLEAANSGTTIRLLMGALAGSSGRWTLTGDASLQRRPMERVAAPLRQMGAEITTSNGCPPVSISGRSLRGIAYPSPVPSAQVKSSLLLAGLHAEGPVVVHEPVQTRDHTERILGWLGADVQVDGTEVRLEAKAQDLPRFELEIPGDYSSAAFLIAAVVLQPGSEVSIEGVGLNPTRRGFEHVLSKMKADIWGEIERADPEPIGRLTCRGALSLDAVELGPTEVAACIDEIPLIAVLATQAEGRTVITGASELRVKESDRIEALAVGLRSLGAVIETYEDGMIIEGPTPLGGGTVDAANDHRLALSFAVAAQAAAGPVDVQGFESAEVSYPGFLNDLRSVTK